MTNDDDAKNEKKWNIVDQDPSVGAEHHDIIICVATIHCCKSTIRPLSTLVSFLLMSNESMNLRALGFCGADDSVHPRMLVLIAHAYPVVEFGVLFRPDKEGQPRYATTNWVKELAAIKPAPMKLAAHLCGDRVNEVLSGDGTFLEQVASWGFQRVQINATAVNGVDTSKMADQVPLVAQVISKFPQLEFILQKNEETKPLWEGLLNMGLPKNVSMLVDESKGTGVSASHWPAPSPDYDIGYAGGIGTKNVEKVLTDIDEVAKGRSIWIDMESSLRSIKNDEDVFDLDMCFLVIQTICKMGFCPQANFEGWS